MASYNTDGARGQSAYRKREDGSSQDLRETLTDQQCRDLIDLVLNTADAMEALQCPRAEPDQKETLLYTTTFDSGKAEADLIGGPTQQPQPQRPKAVPARSATTVAAIKAEAEASRYFHSWRDAVLTRLREALRIDGHRSPLKAKQAQVSLIDLEEDGPSEPAMMQECLLQDLPTETKEIIVNSLLLLLLSLKHYNAHSRVLLVRLALALSLHVADVSDQEVKVAHVLLDSVKEMALVEEEVKRKAEETKASRRWKVGLASVAGAALIGVTGGLAAPLVAAGIGTIMGGLGLGATVVAGYLGAVAGSSIVIGGLFGAYGAKMSGKMMDRYSREVEDFAFLPLGPGPKRSPADPTAAVPSTSDNRLRVTIGISGWLTEGMDVITPWRVLGHDSDVFALRWELKALLRLGSALMTLVKKAALTITSRAVLSQTALAPVMGAVMLPITISRIAYLVDNPFRVAKIRADKAGQILADALINKVQGERSVTLIGYSLGARVIYSCLVSLAKRRAFGLVESAILMGSPTPSAASTWRLMRSVVSGRLVNVHSSNDGVLRFLYRANSMQLDISGIEAISSIESVENYDVSDLVSGHLQYQFLVGKILQRIGFDHLDEREIERQDIRLQETEAEIKHLEEERKATASATSATARPKTSVSTNSPISPKAKVKRTVDTSAAAGMGTSVLTKTTATDATGAAADMGTSVATDSTTTVATAAGIFGGDGANASDTDDEPLHPGIMMVDEEVGDSLDAEQLERDIEAITMERFMSARMGGIQLEDNDT